MPYEALGEFLSELQDNGELVRISAQVDSALELSAITDRVAKSSSDGGPALLFENVRNSSIPVVTNLLGSRGRLCRSLGVQRLDDLSSVLERTESEPSSGWWDNLRATSDLAGLSKWAPRLVKTAACQQVVRMGRDVSLWGLPIPRCWPDEKTPVLTSGQILVTDPYSKGSVVCRSPLIVTGDQEMAWYIDNPAQREIVDAAIVSRQNLPVAISLGGDPVLAVTMALTRDWRFSITCWPPEKEESGNRALPNE